MLTLFSQEHASPVYGVIRETGVVTHRLDQLMVVISHLGLIFSVPLSSCASSVVPLGMGVYTDGVLSLAVWLSCVGYSLPVLQRSILFITPVLPSRETLILVCRNDDWGRCCGSHKESRCAAFSSLFARHA